MGDQIPRAHDSPNREPRYNFTPKDWAEPRLHRLHWKDLYKKSISINSLEYYWFILRIYHLYSFIIYPL